MAKMTAEQLATLFDDLGAINNRVGDAYREAAQIVRASLVETPEQRRERFEAWLWSFVLAALDEEQRSAVDAASQERRRFAKSQFFLRGPQGAYEQENVEQLWLSFDACATYRGPASDA